MTESSEKVLSSTLHLLPAWNRDAIPGGTAANLVPWGQRSHAKDGRVESQSSWVIDNFLEQPAALVPNLLGKKKQKQTPIWWSHYIGFLLHAAKCKLLTIHPGLITNNVHTITIYAALSARHWTTASHPLSHFILTILEVGAYNYYHVTEREMWALRS